TEYGPGGQVLFDGRLTSGASSYRAFKDQWTARPATLPAVSAARSGSAAHLYVSWNGATDVAHWRVWGGHAVRALSHIGVAQVAGFETEIRIPNAPPVVVVEALDSAGTVLAKSRTVRT